MGFEVRAQGKCDICKVVRDGEYSQERHGAYGGLSIRAAHGLDWSSAGVPSIITKTWDGECRSRGICNDCRALINKALFDAVAAIRAESPHWAKGGGDE